MIVKKNIIPYPKCGFGKNEFNSLFLGKVREGRNQKTTDLSLLLSTKNYCIHSSGANKQKIKRIDHRKCNVRASKNAEQAFSTQ